MRLEVVVPGNKCLHGLVLFLNSQTCLDLQIVSPPFCNSKKSQAVLYHERWCAYGSCLACHSAGSLLGARPGSGKALAPLCYLDDWSLDMYYSASAVRTI